MSYRDPSMVGQPLNENEQRAIDLKDSGLSIEAISETMGYATGTVGNMVRTAETKLGRRAPVGQGSTGGRSRATQTPRVQSLADTIRRAYQTAQATVSQLRERLAEVEDEAQLDDEARVNQETLSLQAAVDAAQRKLDEFTGRDEAARTEWLASRKSAAENRLKVVSAEIGSSLDEAEAVMEDIVTKAEVLEIDLSEDEQNVVNETLSPDADESTGEDGDEEDSEATEATGESTS